MTCSVVDRRLPTCPAVVAEVRAAWEEQLECRAARRPWFLPTWGSSRFRRYRRSRHAGGAPQQTSDPAGTVTWQPGRGADGGTAVLSSEAAL